MDNWQQFRTSEFKNDLLLDIQPSKAVKNRKETKESTPDSFLYSYEGKDLPMRWQVDRHKSIRRQSSPLFLVRLVFFELNGRLVITYPLWKLRHNVYVVCRICTWSTWRITATTSVKIWYNVCLYQQTTQLQLKVLFSKDLRNELPRIFIFCLFSFPNLHRLCLFRYVSLVSLSLLFVNYLSFIATYKRHLYGQTEG